jgi:oxygen-independent coproporphyrinogen-3 oxidase
MSIELPSLESKNSLGPAPSLPGEAFGIYTHIPFCSHICPYCDFNTYAGQELRIPAYIEALQHELALWSATFADRVAGSIFVGGGTPSLLAPAQIAEVLNCARNRFALAADVEITLEANPNDISEEYCAGLLVAGVNRLSIGAQSLDRRGLRVLGRRHEAEDVAQAVAAARRAGFANISLDFIFGWPGQTVDAWRSDLAHVLSGSVGGSPPDHLSLYNLIV